MPITIICPGCKSRLTVGDDRGGTTFGCPKGATAISVPVFVGETPRPAPPRRAPTPRPLPPPPPATSDDWDEDEDLTALKRRRKSRRARNRLLALLAVTVVLGAACAILVPKAIQRVEEVRAGKGGSGPRASALSATERKVVGTWQLSELGSSETITFKADRTFVALGRNGAAVTFEVRGEWRVDGEVLIVRATSIEGTGERGEALKEFNDVNVEMPLTIVSISETKILLRSKTGKKAIVYTRL